MALLLMIPAGFSLSPGPRPPPPQPKQQPQPYPSLGRCVHNRSKSEICFIWRQRHNKCSVIAKSVPEQFGENKQNLCVILQQVEAATQRAVAQSPAKPLETKAPISKQPAVLGPISDSQPKAVLRLLHLLLANSRRQAAASQLKRGSTSRTGAVSSDSSDESWSRTTRTLETFFVCFFYISFINLVLKATLCRIPRLSTGEQHTSPWT